MEMGRIQESLGAIWPWALSARGRRLTLLPGDPSPHAVGPCPPPCSSSFHELSQSLAFRSLAKPCRSQAGGDGAGSDEWHGRRQGQCLDTAMSGSVFPALCLVPCWIPPSGCSPVPLSLHSARGQEGSQAALLSLRMDASLSHAQQRDWCWTGNRQGMTGAHPYLCLTVPAQPHTPSSGAVIKIQSDLGADRGTGATSAPQAVLVLPCRDGEGWSCVPFLSWGHGPGQLTD